MFIIITTCSILKPKHLLNSGIWICQQKLVFFAKLGVRCRMRTTSVHLARDEEAMCSPACWQRSLWRVPSYGPREVGREVFWPLGELLFGGRILSRFRAKPLPFFHQKPLRNYSSKRDDLPPKEKECLVDFQEPQSSDTIQERKTVFIMSAHIMGLIC